MRHNIFVRLSAVFAVLLICASYNSISLALEDEEAEALLAGREDVRITMDLQDASLRDVLKMLSVQSGLNFIASEAVADRRLTLYLDKVWLKDALDRIFQVNNLSYELDTEAGIFIIKDWGKPSLELDTRVYFLKYTRVGNSRINQGLSGGSGVSSAGTASTSALTLPDLTPSASGTSPGSGNGLRDALELVLSEYGEIVEDPATNSMVVTDMPNKFPMIEQLITKLDVPIPQVMVEVEVLDVDRSDVDKLGFKYADSPLLRYTGPNFGNTFPFTGATLYKGLRGQIGGTTWNMSGLSFAFDFLSTRSTTRFLARPRLFMLNNETAELKLSADEAIGKTITISGAGGVGGGIGISTETAERAETGVILQVTPQISMATGEITMILQPIVREAVASTIKLTSGTATQDLKDVEERSVKSTVRVKDGETLILGGLIRNRNPVTRTTTPLLGKIPILGMLFRHKHDERRDREILVFITPRIIKNSAQISSGYAHPPKMVGERKQDAVLRPARSEVVSQALRRYEVK
jgi:type II secretory pathway component GspD/PulD (secretin)